MTCFEDLQSKNRREFACPICTEGGKGRPCSQCRADAELGRLVRAMRTGYSLERTTTAWFVILEPKDRYVVLSDGDTPEEALKGGQ